MTSVIFWTVHKYAPPLVWGTAGEPEPEGVYWIVLETVGSAQTLQVQNKQHSNLQTWGTQAVEIRSFSVPSSQVMDKAPATPQRNFLDIWHCALKPQKGFLRYWNCSGPLEHEVHRSLSRNNRCLCCSLTCPSKSTCQVAASSVVPVGCMFQKRWGLG